MKVEDQLLYDLLDGKLSPEREAEVKALIESNIDLKIRFEFLQRLEEDLQELPPDQTSLNFTDSVMEGIDRSGTRLSQNRGTLWIIMAGILMGLVILISGIPDFPMFAWVGEMSGQWITQTSDSIGQILPDSDLMIKIFVFGDLFLILFLLDRYLFRHLIRNRHNHAY